MAYESKKKRKAVVSDKISDTGNESENDKDNTRLVQNVKKPRVKPEKVKEVYTRIVKELVRNHGFGMTEVPLDLLASAVGYKNPRSDAFFDALKLLRNEGMVEKTEPGCRFTDHGVNEYISENESEIITVQL